MLVVAHDDWDGVASAKLLFPGETPIVADYYMLERLADKLVGRVVFVEVHDPAYMTSFDVVVDHHAPKLEHLSFLGDGLTGYAATIGRVLAVSGNRGRDYSNVHAVYSLLNNAEYVSEDGRRLLRSAVEPPEPLIHYSDVIDNPSLAVTREEVEAVLGHAVWKSTGRLRLVASTPAGWVPDALLRYIEEMRREGARVARDPLVRAAAERLRESSIIVAPTPQEYWRAFAAAFIAAKTRGLKRYGFGYRTDGRIRVTLVSRDSWALETALRLGGGGRKTPDGGTVAGATVHPNALRGLMLIPLIEEERDA